MQKNRFIFICCMLLCRFVYAAGDGDPWKALYMQYKSGYIGDTAYLNKAGILAVQYYNDISLKDKLDAYRDIAWSKDAYRPYRIKYYTCLANNATFTYRAGASVYYLEQREKEIAKTKPYINTLAIIRSKYFIYTRNPAGYSRCTEEYNKTLPFLESLPALILSDSVPRRTCLNAMAVLFSQAMIWEYQKDSAKVRKVCLLSERIYSSILKKQDRYKPLDEIQHCMYLILYYKALMADDFAEALSMLDKAYKTIISSGSENILWKNGAEMDMLRVYVDLYLSKGQNDSAARYLNLIKEKQAKGLAELGDGTYYLLTEAKLQSNSSNYKEAYENVLKAYQINDSVIAVKISDIENNLYAQTAAEQQRLELEKAEKQNRKNNAIIIAVSLLVLCVIIFLLAYMRKRDRKSKARISELNRMTQIQIAELEAKAKQIQRKLGMELHDDIAGRLVFVCNYIEKELLTDSTNQPLSKVRDLVKEAYLDTRNKSHEWYSEGLKEEQESFSGSIRKLVEYALQDSSYQKEVEIDELSVQKIPYSLKIQLLRIVQEAMVNILKHAGASKVQLFIYEEDNTIVTQVKDNGKGFDARNISKSNKIGLQSLQERVKEAGGTLDIQSSAKGTGVIVVIPV